MAWKNAWMNAVPFVKPGESKSHPLVYLHFLISLHLVGELNLQGLPVSTIYQPFEPMLEWSSWGIEQLLVRDMTRSNPRPANPIKAASKAQVEVSEEDSSLSSGSSMEADDGESEVIRTRRRRRAVKTVSSEPEGGQKEEDATMVMDQSGENRGFNTGAHRTIDRSSPLLERPSPPASMVVQRSSPPILIERSSPILITRSSLLVIRSSPPPIVGRSSPVPLHDLDDTSASQLTKSLHSQLKL